MYPVNDSLHAALTSSNPSVSFILAETTDSNAATTTIILPYSAFDLTATWPVTGESSNTSQRYFPLKRAYNDTQYVLGRTFLQEAYLAVDYDRSKFYLSPATFPEEASASNVTIVDAPGSAAKHRLGGGPIAGIVVGSIVAVLLIAYYFQYVRNLVVSTIYSGNEAKDNARVQYGHTFNSIALFSLGRGSRRRKKGQPASQTELVQVLSS
jgi:hypothetical protein